MARRDIHFPLKDAALRDDVHTLGGLVGEVLREQGGDELFELVEGDRQAAIARRDNEPEGALQLTIRTRNRDAAQARNLVRAFSTWFQMVNMAEKVHRIRRRRQYFNDANTPQPGGIEDAVQKLKAKGLQLTDVRKLLLDTWIEPIFTAHPTESTRRTILRKQQKVAELLLSGLDLASNSLEGRVNLERIRTEITSGWQTAENSRDRLTVADEREHVLFFLVEVVYKVIPAFYEEIETVLEKVYGPEARDIEVPEILRFGSWVGGDMDNNPDVHAKVIRETVARHQQLIVNSYFLECQQLSELLSQSASRIGISPELQAHIDAYGTLLSNQQSTMSVRQDYMPYRVFLGQIAERLKATYEGRQNYYESAAELLHDVQLIATSLKRNRGAHAGLFHIKRFIRRIRTFGFHLATLDIRQHADVHSSVLAQGLGDSQWQARTAEQRLARLREAIVKNEAPAIALDPNGKRALWVFEAISHCRHRHGADAIGPYVVSMTRGADDILSVLLLAHWADIADRRNGDVAVDVTPLFETAAFLSSCGDVMAALLQEPVYQRHLTGRRNHQFVMLGYSASNKECGPVTSQWLLYQAQESLMRVAAEAKVDLTIFHGRGNTSIRNAGMMETLGRTMPDGALHKRVRLTEQGELINDKYSLGPISLRVFEQAFNALTLCSMGIRPPIKVLPEWREVMDAMSAEGGRVYQSLVYENPLFYEFFRHVTPIDVIERMQIGARSVWRNPQATVNDIQAVPWGYAWAQSRYMLPTWLGAGSALEAVSQRFGDELLSNMYSHWVFFENLVDQVEMGLARADMDIARHYNGLAPEELHDVAAAVRQEYELATKHVLRLKGCVRLLDGEPTMQRSIRLRNPYLDPMHLMQVDLLSRWRAGGKADQELLSALLASINGIARGLQGST